MAEELVHVIRDVNKVAEGFRAAGDGASYMGDQVDRARKLVADMERQTEKTAQIMRLTATGGGFGPPRLPGGVSAPSASGGGALIRYNPADAALADFKADQNRRMVEKLLTPITDPTQRNTPALRLLNLTEQQGERLGDAAMAGQRGDYSRAVSGVWGVVREFLSGPFRAAGDAATYLARKSIEAADLSIEVGRRLNQTALSVTGGNSDSAARLMTYGTAAGVDLDSAALRLHQTALSGTPYQRALAARYGNDLRPDPFGNPDFGAQYLQTIKGIRELKDRDEQLRQIRALGLDNAAPLFGVSDKTFADIESEARTTRKINDGKSLLDAEEQLARRGIHDQALKNNLREVGKPYANLLERIDQWDTDRLNTTAEGNQTGHRSIPNDPLSNWLYHDNARGPGGILQNGLGFPGSDLALQLMQQTKPPFHDETHALTSRLLGTDRAALPSDVDTRSPFGNGDFDLDSPSRSDALEANTREMHDLGLILQQRPLGGGDRARNAVPPALTLNTVYRSRRALHKSTM